MEQFFIASCLGFAGSYRLTQRERLGVIENNPDAGRHAIAGGGVSSCLPAVSDAPRTV
jgi:hypothetical protein